MSERVRQLHASPWQGVIYLTGGGSGLLSEILTTPGASATLLEAQIPYSQSALNELLGTAPDQACGPGTARSLAMAAYERAQHLGSTNAFGLGCTASLTTNRAKRGEHRAHIALQTEWQTLSAALLFDGDRATQEAQLVNDLWALIQTGLALPTVSESPTHITIQRIQAEPDWHAVLTGTRQSAVTAPHDGGLLLSGSFNPLHRGHRQMLAIAEARTGRTGAFELSIINADKPALDYASLAERLAQFQQPVWLTRLPRFIDKAQHFPGAYFVLGIDTLIRLADPLYYESTRDRDRAIEQLGDQQNRFIVFDRQTSGGFVSFTTTPLPETLRQLCIAVSEQEFRDDVSSSALRQRALRPADNQANST